MPITDDFNRADGGLGSGWETLVSLSWAIVSNAAVPTSSGGTNTETRRTESFSGDHYAQCDCEYTDPAAPGSGNSRSGPAVRVQADGSCYRATFTDNDIVIRKVTGGGNNAGTFLTDFIAANWPHTTLRTLKLEAIGSTINVYADGALLGGVTDTDLTGGKPGLFEVTGNPSFIARCDNFECSDAIASETYPAGHGPTIRGKPLLRM